MTPGSRIAAGTVGSGWNTRTKRHIHCQKDDIGDQKRGDQAQTTSGSRQRGSAQG